MKKWMMFEVAICDLKLAKGRSERCQERRTNKIALPFTFPALGEV